MALRQFVVRTLPLTNEAVLIDATSKNNGRIKGIIRDEEVEIGMDTYMASGSVDIDTARKIVQAWAKKHSVSQADVIVRQRLPMNGPVRKSRALNDADIAQGANLKLVPSKSAKEQNADEPDYSSATLEQRVQQFHDTQTRKPAEQPKQEEAKATADKPHGAVVKRSEEEKKATKEAAKKETAEKPVADKPARRKYAKKDKERSARSRSAYERYIKEIGQQVEQHPELVKPATPGEGVTQEQISDAEFQFALKLAKLLKGVM